MVVETDWPEACSGVALSEPSVAVSAAGQSSFVAKIRDVVSSLSGGHGLGIIYWEPGWVGNANLGSPCSVSTVIFYFTLRMT
jgi:arabinogalactan endo-1,4-beta-galactosidase